MHWKLYPLCGGYLGIGTCGQLRLQDCMFFGVHNFCEMQGRMLLCVHGFVFVPCHVFIQLVCASQPQISIMCATEYL